MGRLSNPLESLGALAGQGIPGSKPPRTGRRARPGGTSGTVEELVPEEKGRLSNPRWLSVQRRLERSEVDELVALYEAGLSLRAIARMLGVRHQTVADHLAQRRIPRRIIQPKLSGPGIVEAARHYEQGDSLATVARRLDVDAATVRRAFLRAGVTIRPRRGWACQPPTRRHRERATPTTGTASKIRSGPPMRSDRRRRAVRAGKSELCWTLGA